MNIIELKKIPKWRLLAWCAFVISLSLLCWGILTSSPPDLPSWQWSDKLSHFLGFFCVTLTGRCAIWKSWRYWHWILAILACIALEYLQQLTPGRAFSYLDMLANLSGTFMVFIVWRVALLLFKSAQHSRDN